jgi:hypothetical protein
VGLSAILALGACALQLGISLRSLWLDQHLECASLAREKQWVGSIVECWQLLLRLAASCSLSNRSCACQNTDSNFGLSLRLQQGIAIICSFLELKRAVALFATLGHALGFSPVPLGVGECVGLDSSLGPCSQAVGFVGAGSCHFGKAAMAS